MIKKGQQYFDISASDSIDARIVQIMEDVQPIPGADRFGKIGVCTVTNDGRLIRWRRVEVSNFHDTDLTQSGRKRKVGYVLVRNNSHWMDEQ